MTERIIEPPRQQFDRLLTPLTYGEREVIDLLDDQLPVQWEIYVQPYLNGLRPDIVLLHPGVGIAVFEVKDWDLGAMRYRAEKLDAGRHVLMAEDRHGREFSRERDNPVAKILLYKEELFKLYCPRLDHRAGKALITAGIVFPRAPRHDVERVFGLFRKAHNGMREHPQYYPIAGAESVSSGDVAALFPESRRTSSTYMNDDIAADLRGWLEEPYFSTRQREPLTLSVRQKDLADTRTRTGYRRIRGPAGCGKSVVLAARASWLAAANKHVLVVSFNIALLNYLRDLAVRHVASRQAVRRQIDFLNFHYWCKRVCFASGNGDKYTAIWKPDPDGGQSQALNHGLARLVQRLYRDLPNGVMPKYDAILVDEGQDFRPSWWQALRLALKDGGEIVMVADKTQNVYGTASAWTEDAMKDAGFRGPWVELKGSYRLPPDFIPFIRTFAMEFMTTEETDLPEVVQPDGKLYPVQLRWVQVGEPTRLLAACDSELRRMMQHLHHDTAIADITLLLPRKELGRGLVDVAKRKDLQLLHTFGERNERRQKRAFFQGAPCVKATTPHSFKGWEARHLIVLVESIRSAEDAALFYTALTRLLAHPQGSSLTVVSCCNELRDYGRSWQGEPDDRQGGTYAEFRPSGSQA